MNLLHQVMQAVLYRRNAMAIGMANKVGVFLICCFACNPGSRRINTEQAVA
jgi:hypothetical protein